MSNKRRLFLCNDFRGLRPKGERSFALTANKRYEGGKGGLIQSSLTAVKWKEKSRDGKQRESIPKKAKVFPELMQPIKSEKQLEKVTTLISI